MDDYRQYLKGTHVVPIGALMDSESTYQDDAIVSVAGIVQNVKMKTTRNNSMMAYVTVEDDTASIEMLAFSNVLNQYGGYLRENSPVVITGRLAIRDEKEPQIVINRARPMSDFANAEPRSEAPKTQTGTLYLQLAGESDPRYDKVRAIVNMFPGDQPVVVFFADTRTRRGTKAKLDQRMLNELRNLLGEANVVVK
jgi:DNA polymerase-3 subunit alpha